MNYRTSFTIFAILALSLAACDGQASGTQSTNPESQSGTDPGAVQGENAEDTLGLNQILFGIIALQGAENEVTDEQAAKLLPLLKALNSMSTSGNAAQEEIDALTNQIAAVFTDTQVSAMLSNESDPQSLAALLEDLGIDSPFNFNPEGGQPPEGFSPPDGSTPPGGGGVPGGGPGGGGAPGGGPGGGGVPGGGPGGGGAPGGGINLSPEQQATAEALRAEGQSFGGRGFINNALLEAVISFLEMK